MWDVVYRTIPNWLNAIVLLSGAAFAFFGSGSEDFWSHALHGLLALAIGMLLFRIGAWGGGDAKFYPACAVWLGLGQAPLFAAIAALAGALLVVIFFILKKVGAKRINLGALPYGMAIAGGAIATKVIAASS